jgi:hypothetical protein
LEVFAPEDLPGCDDVEIVAEQKSANRRHEGYQKSVAGSGLPA